MSRKFRIDISWYCCSISRCRILVGITEQFWVDNVFSKQPCTYLHKTTVTSKTTKLDHDNCVWYLLCTRMIEWVGSPTPSDTKQIDTKYKSDEKARSKMMYIIWILICVGSWHVGKKERLLSVEFLISVYDVIRTGKHPSIERNNEVNTA